MKRLFYLIVTAAVFLATANVADAQDAAAKARNRELSKEIFFKGDFFVGIGGGVNVYHGEHDRQLSFHERLVPSMNVYLGKWIIPCLGLRIAYSGGRAVGLTNSDTGGVFSTGTIYRCEKGLDAKPLYWQEFDYLSLSGDLMFNITTLALGYNPDRLYDFTFYGGLGIAKVYEKLEASRFALSFGIFNTFRVAKALDVVVDVRCMGVPEDFEHESGTRPGKKENGLYSHDGILTASVGICYNF